MKTWTRRTFLKTSVAGGTAALLASNKIYGAVAPEAGSAAGDIRVAVVGFNGQGNSHIKGLMEMKGVRLVALCDVDSAVMAKRVEQVGKEGVKVKRYTDYRQLLDDPEIDAVSIATPNHWHSLMTIWACQAGKDVYVEKPLSHNVWEGRQAVAAAKKYNRIVQAGTQSRSSSELMQAAEYLRAGKLGKILWARGFCYKARPSIGKTTSFQRVIPQGIDYDLWSGPAPLVPPTRNTPEHGPIHYDWHWFWNYGGGDIANQGIHQMDVARWLLGEPGLPPSAMSFGGRFGYDDDAETPNTQVAVFNYEKAPLIFEVRGNPMKKGMRAMDAYRSVRGIGVVVQCEGGYFAPGESGGGVVYDNDNKPITRFTGTGGTVHRQNWIDAVRSRKGETLNAKIEECHLSSSLCHLANISYRIGQERTNAEVMEAVNADANAKDSFGRMLEHLKANEVDVTATNTVLGPALRVVKGAERFESKEKGDVGDRANALLRRDYRAPFVVPELVA